MNMIKSGEQKVYVEFPNFTGRNVPIREIAEAIGKDAQYIRIGLQEGWLKFGYAKKIGASSRIQLLLSGQKSVGRNRLFQRCR